MTQYKFGIDAIEESSSKDGGSASNEFAKLLSGTSIKVKLVGLKGVMSYYGYGIFRPRVATFAAENPSKRNGKGFVESDHTPWDLASKHYYDQAFKLTEGKDDEEAKEIRESAEYKRLTSEGFKYAGKQRFAVGFIDLEVGKEIVLDFTRKQFNDVIKPIIVKYDKNKDQAAFEIAKTGQRQDTKVTLMPLFSLDELSDKEQANFHKYVEKDFDTSLFQGLVYEMDDDEQIEKLIEAGFDVSLIGLEAPAKKESEAKGVGSGEDGEITDDDLPF